ncbi:glycosyltransferase family 4 protein [Dietzia sp. MNB45]|uniref:glycosyltransferase family 4 protein n=1 Tax=Dietzia sp. MNB45 TaxID=3238800 RepID=UPI003F7E8327
MNTRNVVLVNASGMRSGAENVLGGVAQTLAATGAQIILVSPHGPVVGAFPSGTVHVAIDTLGLQGRSGASRIIAVARVAAAWIRAGRTLRRVVGPSDTVVVNSLFALPALPAAFPRGRHTGLTTWFVHDTVVSRKQRVAVRLGARHLDRAVAVSGATAASVRGLVREVILRPHGVEIGDDDAFGSPDRGQVIGILATLTPWKGHDVLLEAVARIPHLILEIAGGELPGESSYVATLKARAEQDDLRGRVVFLGHVDRSEVLSRWSVAVSASILPEAGPLVALEAMAAGVPVVATSHGGVREYLSDGAGVLVAPGDVDALSRALQELTGDARRREEIARVARARVKRSHDIRRTLPAMVDALTIDKP